MALLHHFELAGREEVHAAEKREPTGDELGAALERMRGLVLREDADGLSRIAIVTRAQERLRVRDAAVEITSRAILVCNPEICSGHLNFRDRDSHFIFGDVATAVILEEESQATGGWEILGTRLKTQFSNNIRNNFGFLNRTAPEGIGAKDKQLHPYDGHGHDAGRVRHSAIVDRFFAHHLLGREVSG